MLVAQRAKDQMVKDGKIGRVSGEEEAKAEAEEVRGLRVQRGRGLANGGSCVS